METENKPVKIDIGCGGLHIKDYIRIDKYASVEPDYVVDMETDTLPFKDNSVDDIICIHTLEHIKNTKHFFEETYRVLKPTGRMNIVIPHYLSEWSYGDPEHVSHYSQRFFEFVSRGCQGRDYRYLEWGNFDFDVTNFVYRLSKKAKERFKTQDELELASYFLANVVEEVDVTLAPVKPIRKVIHGIEPRKIVANYE